MNQLKTSLSTLATMASLLAVVACGSSNKAPANSPSAAQNSSQEQTGSTMAQPGSAGETGAANNTTGGATSPQTGDVQGGAASGAQGGMQNSGSTGMGPEGHSMNSGADSNSQTGGGSATGTSPTTGAPSTMANSNDTSNLTDGQVAGVLQAINQAQIQQALLAQKQASSPEVKRFARQMVTAYRSVQTKESALFQRLQISPSESTLSNDLRADAQNELSTLQSSKGKDFDRSYVDSEVTHLQNVSDLVDRAMRDARSAELKSELQNVRTKVDGHLRDAQRLQQSIQSGGKTTP